MKRPRIPRSRWDELYGSGQFLGRWHYDHPSQELVAFIACGRSPAGGRVLDLGCGAGTDAIFLAALGFQVTGVDFSRQAISIARRQAKAASVQVQFQVADVLELPLRSGSMDLVSDRGCFHHLPDGDRPRYADEVHRVLRRGGLLLLRGCSGGASGFFEPLTGSALDRHFDSGRFRRGPLLPIALAVNAGFVPANLAVLEKL